MEESEVKDLERQGYRIVGNHSAIKVCHWTKECIRGVDSCYKNEFYGINTHQCVQMTPTLPICTHRCIWCWRDLNHTKNEWNGEIDEPEKIIEDCIQAHKSVLNGFKGNEKVTEKMFEEAMDPKHFAISLAGEPTLYPKLPEMIEKLREKGITSFLVTNGTNPEMLRKLLKNPPTQLYLTIPAPDEETYNKVCKPLVNDGWSKIKESIELLKKFPRHVARLTLVKGENMFSPEKYAELLKGVEFIELKAYVWVGHSRERLKIENMPLHKEIKEFTEKIKDNMEEDYSIVKEKENSRVVLLKKNDINTSLVYESP